MSNLMKKVLKIQICQEAGQVVWYSHHFQNFPQFIVIHTVKGFGIVNKAEIDVFLELSCFLDNPADVGNLISGSSTFSKTSLNIWKFMVHVLLKPCLENFEHYFTSEWMKVSEITQSCPTLCNPMDSSLYQASPSMEFSRQECWSGLPFPSPGNFPDPGIEPRSPTLQAESLSAEPQGSPRIQEWVAYPPGGWMWGLVCHPRCNWPVSPALLPRSPGWQAHDGGHPLVP